MQKVLILRTVNPTVTASRSREKQTHCLFFLCYVEVLMQTKNNLGLFAIHKSPFIVYLLYNLNEGFQ